MAQHRLVGDGPRIKADARRLSELTDYAQRVRFGELLLAGAREILPPDSWCRTQVPGRARLRCSRGAPIGREFSLWA